VGFCHGGVATDVEGRVDRPVLFCYNISIMSWAMKRRLIYGGSVLLFLVIVFGGIFWKLFYSKPTCSDGTKNGDEKGIDCGGSCKNLCTSDALKPIIIWAKIFHISGDVYSAVAYVENPNINSKNARATYQFRLFDTENKLITIVNGETSISKGQKFAVFETGVILKNRKPKNADFQFVNFSNWEKDLRAEDGLSVEYGTILFASTTPQINGVISNESLENVKSVELVVFAIDSSENVIGASRTFVDNLLRNTSQDFVFTWQKPFEREASVINVMYRSL
jgi:hypothetical protein